MIRSGRVEVPNFGCPPQSANRGGSATLGPINTQFGSAQRFGRESPNDRIRGPARKAPRGENAIKMQFKIVILTAWNQFCWLSVRVCVGKLRLKALRAVHLVEVGGNNDRSNRSLP